VPARGLVGVETEGEQEHAQTGGEEEQADDVEFFGVVDGGLGGCASAIGTRGHKAGGVSFPVVSVEDVEKGRRC